LNIDKIKGLSSCRFHALIELVPSHTMNLFDIIENKIFWSDLNIDKIKGISSCRFPALIELVPSHTMNLFDIIENKMF
jgi:hypothetical protein